MSFNKIFKTKFFTFKGILSVCLSMIILSGCQTTTQLSSDLSSRQTQGYLNKAKNSSGDMRTHWLLKASESLLNNHNTSKSIEILESINTSGLSSENSTLYHSLLGIALLQANRVNQSLNQFKNVNNIQLLSNQQAIQFHLNYSLALEKANLYYDSSIQRIQLSQLYTDQLDIEENTELLWQSLLRINNISIYINSLNSILVNGWLELASIAKTYANEPDLLLKNLEVWHNRFNDHPANNQLPIDMAKAEAARSYHPNQIAVLLPESGKFSTSADQIRQGLITAMFETPSEIRPKIKFYDTSSGTDIQNLYQKAVDEGANFIIGPLKQSLVLELSQMESFPVPVLAINRIDNDRVIADNFYQFGLPIEDEARQIAQRAWLDGRKKALVLVPNGILGSRTSKAFSDEFERLGGMVQQVVNYGDTKDYSRAVQTLLGVDKSLERFNKLRMLFRMKAYHESRRRQDSDFIFFKATPKQARIIKPFIDFYYAQDLPVYSSSSIYSGQKDAKKDSDLNRVIFCDIPWLLSNSEFINRQRQKISNLWENSVRSNKARLFALGYDTKSLIPELNKLKNFPAYHLSGLSGSLTVDDLGHVNRQLSWAQFIRGKAIILPPKSPELDIQKYSKIE